MGDRVSIAFKNKHGVSIRLFSHWGGMDFVSRAKKYVQDLKKEIEYRQFKGDPLGRLEPNTVMVDFIREITTGINRINSDLYLGADSNSGDDSDNGGHDIEL